VTHAITFFTARRSAECGYAIVNRPSVGLVRLSVMLPQYCDHNFCIFENNYTIISLLFSQSVGKEAPICYKGVAPKFQVE